MEQASTEELLVSQTRDDRERQIRRKRRENAARHYEKVRLRKAEHRLRQLELEDAMASLERERVDAELREGEWLDGELERKLGRDGGFAPVSAVELVFGSYWIKPVSR